MCMYNNQGRIVFIVFRAFLILNCLQKISFAYDDSSSILVCAGYSDTL